MLTGGDFRLANSSSFSFKYVQFFAHMESSKIDTVYIIPPFTENQINVLNILSSTVVGKRNAKGAKKRQKVWVRCKY
jgi:hypothetical protein